jgi:SulP family sulfate permease
MTAVTVSDIEAVFPERRAPRRRAALPVAELTQSERAEKSHARRLRQLAPIVDWLPRFGRDNSYYKATPGATLADGVRRDVITGIVIGIMLVPQSMAYAMLAGLPPVFGLYSSTWSILSYAFLGTCKYLGPGVNAPISILVVNSLSQALELPTGCGDDPESEDCAAFINASMLLCLMVGGIYILLGALRLGFVTVFIPEPALSGFTTGASIIIITSNVKYFLGISPAGGGSVIATWVDIVGQIHAVNWAALLMGVGAFAMLWLLQSVNRRPAIKAKLPMPIPEQLVVMVVTTAVAAMWDLEATQSMQVVGHIPPGLYTPQMPTVSMELVGKLISPAVTVALVTYILTINVAKAVGTKGDLAVDPNQELFALAGTSIVGGLTGSCVPSGSFSRTALILLLRPESPMHCVYTALVVCMISLTMTGPLYHLPKATLAAIIFVALRSLLDWSRARALWRVSKVEFAQWIVSFGGTVLFGVQGGIMASICLSVMLLLKSASQPPTAVLGALPFAPPDSGTSGGRRDDDASSVFVDIKRFDDAAEIPGIKIFRFSAPLTFANKDFLEQKLLKMHRQDTSAVPVHTVVLDCGSVTTVDTSAAGTLMKIISDYQRSDHRLLLANWRGLDTSGNAVLQSVEFDSLLSKDHWFLTVAHAVAFAADAGPPQRQQQQQQQQDERKSNTPLASGRCAQAVQLDADAGAAIDDSVREEEEEQAAAAEEEEEEEEATTIASPISCSTRRSRGVEHRTAEY